eukprot:GHVR01121466.1.p2 GENE.GHVR01121466.1~~GHVR01121466.1.p2  ORF type:complete len:116 (-),score=26.38 GHVR01121466.1:9-356(-)
MSSCNLLSNAIEGTPIFAVTHRQTTTKGEAHKCILNFVCICMYTYTQNTHNIHTIYTQYTHNIHTKNIRETDANANKYTPPDTDTLTDRYKPKNIPGDRYVYEHIWTYINIYGHV